MIAGPVDLVTFRTLLETIAAERPDFVYRKPDVSQECLYRPSQRRPGQKKVRCIIGEALHRLGMTDAELFELDASDESNAYDVLSGLGFDDDVCHYAQMVQTAQDTGKSWGAAILAGVHEENDT